MQVHHGMQQHSATVTFAARGASGDAAFLVHHRQQFVVIVFNGGKFTDFSSDGEIRRKKCARQIGAYTFYTK